VPVARDSDRSFQPVSREAGGPCKHSAKQKAFGTVLAWAVFSFTTAPKNPKAKWGLFGALGKRGERRWGRGVSPTALPTRNALQSEGTAAWLIRGSHRMEECTVTAAATPTAPRRAWQVLTFSWKDTEIRGELMTISVRLCVSWHRGSLLASDRWEGPPVINPYHRGSV